MFNNDSLNFPSLYQKEAITLQTNAKATKAKFMNKLVHAKFRES